MEQMLQIRCKNNKKSLNVPIGSTLLETYYAFNLQMPYGPCSAKVNNKVTGLDFRLYHDKDVEFQDITSSSGMRTYTRSLLFVLCKAVEQLYPHGRIIMGAPVSKGYYLRLCIGRPVEQEDVSRIKSGMQELIARDLPFKRVECPTEDAIRVFEQRGRVSKVRLLTSQGKCYTSYYTLDGMPDYFYGSLLPSTGRLHLFDLMLYRDGLLLRIPRKQDPSQLEEFVLQEKMLDIFQEHQHWQEILGVSTVGDFNWACQQGHAVDLINVSEALQEKKIVRIADEIAGRKEVKVVLIAGPSSSGKTTFSKRLSVQLMTNGLKPYPISLDDYFVDRTRTPRDEQGEYDYESLYALDLDLFNQHLSQLLRGEEIELPRYNFMTGMREASGKRLRLDDQMVLILEGIHALNPGLTPLIPAENTFKIYVSALTTILLDDHNYIPTTDNRLLRRIIRDYKYRGSSAQSTIARWPSVRAGEEKWIFPYQENADAMFNSALLFELAVIKNEAVQVLEQVPENVPEYSEAYRLKKFLQYITPMSDEQLPPTSLLREFLGGSSFTY